jgi:UDP-N-acetylmuramate dehydrogenase
MKIQENTSLLPYNTFGLPAKAAHFAAIDTPDALRVALRTGIRPVFILGGGSNVLFTRDPEGLVLRNVIKGIEIVRRFSHRVWVRFGGGETWHDGVLWAVSQGLGGIENMSLIPGTVGAAPIQNIGAYGVELKDVFVSLEAMDLETGKLHRFNRAQCRFGYRDSFFKREGKGKYCIVSVTLSLTTDRHKLNMAYGDIRKTLETDGISNPGIADISRAVIRIRSSKLPDPARIGNCGSFFKNPETDRAVLDRILATHPQAPHFPLPDGRVKIPAGWLIEQCGWKGKRVGNTGCYEKQALVLVNHGGATGSEVRELAFAIIESVEKNFGIRLEPEVNIV